MDHVFNSRVWEADTGGVSIEFWASQDYRKKKKVNIIRIL